MLTAPSFPELVAGVGRRLAPSLVEDWPGLAVQSASGLELHCVDGTTYLDFTSGIATANTGHCHPRVVDAAKRQTELMIHSAVGITYHESLVRLCEALAGVTPPGLDMFFFGNSGAEAVEGAIKLARYVTRRPAIVAFMGGFHGRTYGAATLTTAKAKYRLHYEPFIGSVYFAPYADPFHGGYGSEEARCASDALNGLRQLLDRIVPPSEIAALVVEPVQGEGGYIVPPKAFLAGLREICDEIGALLVFDEVQTGFGRTGEMFAAQTFGVTPDVMAVGKGIASGFPLSATIARGELMRQWLAGSHGTTFGGNPVSCAAALATLEVIDDEQLLKNCRLQGHRLLEGLRQIQGRNPILADVRGVGLMAALEFAAPGGSSEGTQEPAMRVLEGCLKRGLLLYMAGPHSEVVRMMPPLIVGSVEVERALSVIDEAITEVNGTH
jgi:4-aminobutyrate aminotransferase